MRRHDEGRLIVRFKRPWKDATAAVVLNPLELIARLAALVPSPWFNLIRYHGVLAPPAALRPEVVPQNTRDATELQTTPTGQLWLVGFAPCADRAAAARTPPPHPPPSRSSWAKLLARVFRVDVTVCPRCSGSMRIVAFLTDPHDIDTQLASAPRPPPAPLASQPPTVTAAHGSMHSPQTAFAFTR